jgi:pilus assembly protein FimV
VGRTITVAILAVACVLATPLAVHAAGLGRLTVLSSLGQPLQAEIEIVSLQAGEEEGLTARLASPEAFAQAGIELNPAVMGIRFAVERRGGRMMLRLSSAQAISEPFLDVLVELQWATGRLLREYTFLLDPPDYKSRQPIAAAPAARAADLPPLAAPPAPGEAKPEAKPEAPAPEAAKPESIIEAQSLPPPAAVESKPEEPKAEARPEEPKPQAQPEAKPSAAGAAPAATHEVKKGDTLGAIARRNLPPGVTLNQMLIAIYRANEDAFIRGNVNLVRAGKILSIPDAESVASIDPAEANRIFSTHIREFNEYRSRLAAVPAKAEAVTGQREVAGPIEQKPVAPPAPTQDQLRLSKVDPKKPAGTGTRAAQGDDAVARERALQEAQSRQADLEKNVADLRKLLELKNQQLAELEKKAAAKPAAPAVPVAPPAPAPAAKAPEKPAAKAPEAPKPAAPAPAAKAPEAPKPAPEAPKPAAEAPKPPAPAAKPGAEAPKPAAAKPKPPPDPGVLDQVLENPELAFGGLALVVLGLGGYGYWQWRRKKTAHAKFQDSVLGAASVGSASGGPSLNEPTGSPGGAATAPAAGAKPSRLEAEEVDPIAEADVYMAYGRDAQAEEILKEALQKDSGRTAVHAKLLEIYANRKDARGFEQTALKLKGLTNGAGPEWDKAAALGRSIDPQNGLYAGSGDAPAPAAAPASGGGAPQIDFDLGGGDKTAGVSVPDIPLEEPAKETSAPTNIDFDLGGAPAAPAEPAKAFNAAETVLGRQEPVATSIDFNLDLGGDTKPTAAAPAAPKAASGGGGLDFDLNLGGDSAPKTAGAEKPMDLSSISLDLGGTEAAVAPAQTSTDPKWQEVATKLDLAKAYEEMGDKDGARELLNEVMKDGDAAQKGQAQQLLSKLG